MLEYLALAFSHSFFLLFWGALYLCVPTTRCLYRPKYVRCRKSSLTGNTVKYFCGIFVITGLMILRVSVFVVLCASMLVLVFYRQQCQKKKHREDMRCLEEIRLGIDAFGMLINAGMQTKQALERVSMDDRFMLSHNLWKRLLSQMSWRSGKNSESKGGHQEELMPFLGTEWPHSKNIWRLVVGFFVIEKESGVSFLELLPQLLHMVQKNVDLQKTIVIQTTSAQASATILQLLPVLGLFLGAVMGAHPLSFLLHTTLGSFSLCIGTLFLVSGMVWTEKIIATVRNAT